MRNPDGREWSSMAGFRQEMRFYPSTLGYRIPICECPFAGLRKDSLRVTAANIGVTCRVYMRWTTTYWVYGNMLRISSMELVHSGFGGGPTRTRTWDRPIMSRML